MKTFGVHSKARLDWAVATRPVPGQSVSGDFHVIQSFDDGVLIGVIDGVGHGDEATAAARAAADILVRHAGESVISMVERCHGALAMTRGVVMTVASLHHNDGTVTWLGVGNVEGQLFRPDSDASQPAESVLLRGGLVGYQLPALQASVIPVAPGDLLVFATDGIRAGFAGGINDSEAPKQIADRIMSQHFKGTDDALVLVVRYLGVEP